MSPTISVLFTCELLPIEFPSFVVYLHGWLCGSLIQDHSSVKWLRASCSLSEKEISDAGAYALSEALRVNHSLQELE